MEDENAKQLRLIIMLLITMIHVGLSLTKPSNLNNEITEKLRRIEMISSNTTNNNHFKKEKIPDSSGNNTAVNQDGECSNGKAKCHFYIKRMINFYRKVKTSEATTKGVL